MAVSIEDIIYTLPAEPRPIDLQALYGNAHPVELEIGSGKGGFLLEQARCHVQRNYLGIEWANQYFRFAADRMARWGVCNVRMLRGDAKQVVQHYLPAASLAAVHVYHPDPWPKRRHHKRRLFDPAFVAALSEVLDDGGGLEVQTDHGEYFEWICASLAACPVLEMTLCGGHNGLGQDRIVETNYQAKYRREGRPAFRLAATRKPRDRAG